MIVWNNMQPFHWEIHCDGKQINMNNSKSEIINAYANTILAKIAS